MILRTCQFLGLAAVLLCTGSQANAGLITFEISNIVLTPGPGVDHTPFEQAGSSPLATPPNPSGFEDGRNGGKVLGVQVTAPVSSLNLDVQSTAGATSAGSVAHLGFTAAETFITNGEANTANSKTNFTLAFDIKAFGDAVAQSVVLTLTGVATPGNVKDAAVDYLLNSNIAHLTYRGGAGMYDLSVVGLSLSNSSPASLDLQVSIVNPVPEPTSIALLLCGGVATVIAGYRRRVVA